MRTNIRFIVVEDICALCALTAVVTEDPGRPVDAYLTTAFIVGCLQASGGTIRLCRRHDFECRGAIEVAESVASPIFNKGAPS